MSSLFFVSVLETGHWAGHFYSGGYLTPLLHHSNKEKVPPHFKPCCLLSQVQWACSTSCCQVGQVSSHKQVFTIHFVVQDFERLDHVKVRALWFSSTVPPTRCVVLHLSRNFPLPISPLGLFVGSFSTFIRNCRAIQVIILFADVGLNMLINLILYLNV